MCIVCMLLVHASTIASNFRIDFPSHRYLMQQSSEVFHHPCRCTSWTTLFFLFKYQFIFIIIALNVLNRQNCTTLHRSWQPFNFHFINFVFFVSVLLTQVTGLTVKSYPLTVDTTQAIKMKPEPSSSEIVTETEIETSEIDSQSNDSYDFAENYRRRLISVTDAEYRYKSLVLGMCAALIVFLFILTVLCASHRYSSDSKSDSHPSNAQQTNVLLTEVITVRS